MTPRSHASASPLRAVVAAMVLLASAAAIADGPLELPGDPVPAALAQLAKLDPLDKALTLTLAADGSRAAVAFRGRPKFSVVRISTDGGEFDEVELKGTVRSLHIDPDSMALFAVVHRLGSKDRVREAYLAHIDLTTLRTSRSITLPTTSTDLDSWSAGSALLVASENEVRTILLPDVRTGPLFWIVGENRSIATLGRSDFVLVGQLDRIALVNLGDPQGRQELPLRESVAVPSPVMELASSPDGDRALARLEDGTTLDVRLDPLRIERRGKATAIAWLGQPTSGSTAPSSAPLAEENVASEAPAVAAGAAGSAAVSAPSPPAPAPPPEADAARDSEPIVAEIAPAAEPDAAREPEPDPVGTDPAPERTEARPLSEPAPSPPAESAPDESALPPTADPELGELVGSVSGPAADRVVAVVLLGPDNILHEAARITPAGDGSWTAPDLAPGRYRILVDGGGTRVLSTRPAFRLATAEAGRRVTVDDIEVLRSIDR